MLKLMKTGSVHCDVCVLVFLFFLFNYYHLNVKRALVLRGHSIQTEVDFFFLTDSLIILILFQGKG